MGRPPINDETRKLVIELYNNSDMTCNQIAQACNISPASLYRIINKARKEAECQENVELLQ